jgi:hypothetical protein
VFPDRLKGSTIMTPVIDFVTARSDLEESLAKAEAALGTATDRVGELALDRQLGSSQGTPPALGEARTAQVAAERQVAELRLALERLEDRAADQAVADAEKARKADQNRVVELAKLRRGAMRKLLDELPSLGATVETILETEAQELAIAHRLGEERSARAQYDVQNLLLAEFHCVLGRGTPALPTSQIAAVRERAAAAAKSA